MCDDGVMTIMPYSSDEQYVASPRSKYEQEHFVNESGRVHLLLCQMMIRLM